MAANTIIPDLKCLIVDDEPLARELLTTFCGHLTGLIVTGVVGSALDAKKFLILNRVDLLFLDINMPVLDGIALLNTLPNPPVVIMTTAYKQHAVTAFELDVCDYLVKPFSLERFITAVDRARSRLAAMQPDALKSSNEADALFIKTEGRIYRIMASEVLYIEANGNHSKIITEEMSLSPVMPFSSLQDMLPKTQFVQVHRSFVINKSKISLIEGNRLFIGKQEIPIGRNFKEAFFADLRI